MKIAGLELIDSGALGGGCLVNGKNCGGYYAKYQLPSGNIGLTEVLYNEDNDVEQKTIEIYDADEDEEIFDYPEYDTDYAILEKALAEEIEEEKFL
jgi:hypothetical protein